MVTIKPQIKQGIISLLALLSTHLAFATTYLLPLPGQQVVGKVIQSYIQPNQTIDDVAREYDVGYYEILAANPQVNPLSPMPYQAVTIPSQFILPPQPWTGIIVNVAELRLYYFPPNKPVVETYPVAIGMEGSGTPVGDFHIIEKIPHPAWYVPKQVQDEMARQGVLLPAVMPAGPENPLGDYALRLNNYSYLIHGTNVPATIGRRASAGCMHMFPEDILKLFPQIPVNTPVTIIDQPFQAGWDGTGLYFKAEQPLHEDRTNMAFNYPHYWQTAINAVIPDNLKLNIDWGQVKLAGEGQLGIPVKISSLSG